MRGVNTNYRRGDLCLLRALQIVPPLKKDTMVPIKSMGTKSDDDSVIITDGS